MTDLANVVRGYLMGSADVVPGVSGGTVALVLGIYERLVHEIRTGAGVLGALVRFRFGEARERLRAIDWRFLLPLLAGIALAVVSLAALIDRLLEDEPQNTASAFFGFVAGSIVIAWHLVRTWNAVVVALGLTVAAAALALLGLRGDEVIDPALPLFLGAGMVAIVAMILPGISGSFILLILGMYQPVLDAVNERDLGVLAVFAAGAVVGLALFSTALDRMLRHHHDAVLAGLIGLMAGSLRVLWPWPDGTATARLAAPETELAPIVLAVLGFMVVLAIGAWARRGAAGSR